MIEAPTRTVWSYSRLHNYIQCSYSYYLTRVLKLPEVPAVWNAGGTAFHLVSEAFDRQYWQADDLSSIDVQFWQNLFQIEFDLQLDELYAREPDATLWRAAKAGKPTKARPYGEDIAWWREHGPVFVAGYVQWRQQTNSTLRIASIAEDEDGQLVPGIEVPVVTDFEGIPVRGYIDRVFVELQTGDLIIVDMKSGSRIPDLEQVGTYARMFGKLYHIRLRIQGAYYDARKGALQPVADLTAYTEQQLAARYRWADQNLSAGVFTPSITPLCKACPVKQSCYAQGGSLPAAPTETEALPIGAE